MSVTQTDFSGAHVLVTGGAGFIGSHLVDAYLARGSRVTVLDDLSTGTAGNLAAGAELVEGDIRDTRVLDRLFRERFDLVNHHAAQIDVRRSVSDPAFDAEVNVVGSLRLLERAAAAGTGRFIFASSGGAIYGEPQAVPQTEDHPAAPISPYGCAKLSIEHYLHYYREVRGLHFTALRYANVYGPRQRTDGEAGVVAIFMGHVLRDEPVTINGDGTQTRDYVYVDDVIHANMAASALDLPGAWNVGTGIETSVLDLFELIRESSGRPAEARRAPAKAGEQMRSSLDGSRLWRAANLSPMVSLRDGLRHSLDWFTHV